MDRNRVKTKIANSTKGQTEKPEDLQRQRQLEKPYERISPFEFKDKLIDLATDHQKKSVYVMLNAGRGNPNWIAATPREAFFALGQFAVEESRRAWNEGDLAGKPHKEKVFGRLENYLAAHESLPGVQMLREVVFYGINELKFEPDEWVHQLVDGIIGDNYPVPDRMLTCPERLVRDFLLKELCQNRKDLGQFQLFAVEGATAAMCYIFESLMANFLLHQGDKVAVMVPIFPPYVEIPELARYRFDVVEIRADAYDADGWHTWQYPERELDKLRDPQIKALFLVNPSNPPSYAMNPESLQYLKNIVYVDNPDLMVISDDVYSTFVDGYQSLLELLPHNTLGVYSFSKYFGVTGWRLGVVALHETNIFDKLLPKLPLEDLRRLDARYASMTEHPRNVKFINRIVADSRQVALNHTAGLSTPQQIQMALMAGFALLDKQDTYKEQTKKICRRRRRNLYQGLNLEEPKLPYSADYYTEFDLELWAKKHYGEGFAQYLKDNYEPVDILFRLAEQSSIVLLNGGGFHGPRWSVRVSLANLEDEAYVRIGDELHKALEEYVKEWQRSSLQDN